MKVTNHENINLQLLKHSYSCIQMMWSSTIKKQICVNILEDFIKKYDDNGRRRSPEGLMYNLKV